MEVLCGSVPGESTVFAVSPRQADACRRPGASSV